MSIGGQFNVSPLNFIQADPQAMHSLDLLKGSKCTDLSLLEAFFKEIKTALNITKLIFYLVLFSNQIISNINLRVLNKSFHSFKNKIFLSKQLSISAKKRTKFDS
ncbi:hypothetical protein BpHYR1_003050 [Brachionus plicatilis]|uniref:Uncharacterized protein n=1 Tax=Brachionus plicatilis TaxID=10195 RepID=A0A3M7QZX6_BRAPC|nr:hypothetical protein BpHYR1_003050 [Brachionus plicatilis]